jgi:hypothetical protein
VSISLTTKHFFLKSTFWVSFPKHVLLLLILMIYFILFIEYNIPVEKEEESNITSTPSSTRTSDPKTAICFSGGLRSFYRPIVHTSLLHNFVNSLEPDESKRDIFFTVSPELNCFNSHVGFSKDSCGLGDNQIKDVLYNDPQEMEKLIKSIFQPKALDMNEPPL